jgi:hypothetical protein
MISRPTRKLLILAFVTATSVLITCCSQTTDIVSKHKKYFDVLLPSRAYNIKIEQPKFYTRWRDDYIIIEYTLPEAEIKAFKEDIAKSYSSWQPLNEVYVGGRLFTQTQMPDAVLAQTKSEHIYKGIIINKNRITCVYFSS